MSGYRATITLEKLLCKDTESIHSSDHVLIMGEVQHDGSRTPFVLPGFRLNDWETRLFADGVIFDEIVNSTEVTLVLGVWDIDSNDAWVDNRETIIEVANGIAIALKFAVPVAGGLFGAFVNIASGVIDKFVDWDKNDVLLAYEQVLKLGGLEKASYERVDVPFYRHEWPDYSGFDYVLTYLLSSQWQIGFDEKEPPEVTYQPDKGSVPSSWLGNWIADGIEVSISKTPGEDERFAKGLLDVTVTEKIGKRTQTTTTTGVTFEKDLVLGKILGRKGRRPKDELDLEPAGMGNLKGAIVGGDGGDGGGKPGERLEPGPALPGQQYGGDHLTLNGEASLEMYRMVNPATPDTTPALRYRHPVGSPLHMLEPGGKDVMLHRQTNL